MRQHRRGIALALMLTGVGALVATLAESVWTTVQTVMLLHGKFGLPVSMALEAISQAYSAALTFFVIAAALFWPLASWRLPLPIFAGGLLALVGAAFLVTNRSDLDRVQLVVAMLILGVAANLFLRAVKWAYDRWIPTPTEGSTT